MIITSKTMEELNAAEGLVQRRLRSLMNIRLENGLNKDRAVSYLLAAIDEYNECVKRIRP